MQDDSWIENFDPQGLKKHHTSLIVDAHDIKVGSSANIKKYADWIKKETNGKATRNK
jgi:hypothetical protein